MTCEIELPLTDFYLSVDNEELCHLWQGWVIKATGRRGIRPVWLESRRPWFPVQALYTWVSPSGNRELYELQCFSHSRVPASPIVNTSERQGCPLKSAAWETKRAQMELLKTARSLPGHSSCSWLGFEVLWAVFPSLTTDLPQARVGNIA